MTNVQPVSVIGIGTSVPKHSLNQKEAIEMTKSFYWLENKEHERLLNLFYEKSNVEQRGSVLIEKNGHGLQTVPLFRPITSSSDSGPTTADRMEFYKREAPILATESVERALSQSGTRPDQITHLITVSCTGFSAPGFDIALIKKFGLSAEVSRTHIGFMGCHGLLNALRVARLAALEDPASHILVCSVELCSIHFAYGWDPGRAVANSLFSDGSAAAIISSTGPKKDNWKLIGAGSHLFGDSEDLMQWEVGNNGFVMSLSPKVPSLIKENLAPFLSKWLQKFSLSLSDIRSWAVHPGGPKVLSGVESALQLPAESLHISRGVLARFGNMSSATILFILNELIQSNASTPCVALGFGPGLHVETALFV